MPRSGTGTYSLPAPAPFQNGTTIDAPGMNTVQSDIATALTQSVAADGQTPITGNWNFKGYSITNLASLGITGAVSVGTTLTIGTALTVGTSATIANGLTVTKGGATVSAGGISVVGNSAIAGTLGTSSTIAVAAGGISIVGNSTVTGTVTISGTVGAAQGTKSGLAVTYDQFPTTTGATGTITLPSGLIMKWGTGSTAAGTGSVTFGAAFPTACRNVQITINQGTGTTSLNPVIAGTVTASGFAVWGAAAQSLTFFWQAIGD